MTSADIILSLIKERKLSAARVSRDTDISEVLFSQWKSGKQQPSPRYLAILANYFNVSIDYLLGKESASESPSIQDPQITILSRAARNMTAEQKDKLVEMAKLLYPEAFKEK